ncbi:MAG: prepilin-type N-terminal cleavage/methylation domain-containing protein [Crenarchaeota archaeon]|nr:prepilin-type N-terminal cleavage/methylation domain-containing protein [Thermoproteota archaeon]
MKRNGFSLLELSIVLIIIGLLTTLVIAAKTLIDSSKVARAVTLTSSSGINKEEGLIFWLETSLLTKENIGTDNIYEWRDIGPYSIVFKNATTNNLPLRSGYISGIKAIYFSGYSYYSMDGNPPNLSEYTSFVVSNPDGNTGSIYNSNFKLKASDVNQNIVIVKNTGEKKYIKEYKNYSFKQMANDDTLDTTSSFFTIGADSFKGYIYEIIVFDRVLEDKEVAKIEQYLHNKYTK